MSTPATITGTARVAVPQLLAELQHADAIIKVMLNAMTMRQKIKAHEVLRAAGICDEGLTRHHERAAVIEAASAGAAPANTDQDRSADVARYEPISAIEVEDTLILAHAQAEAVGAILRSIARMSDDRDIMGLCKHGHGLVDQFVNDTDLLRERAVNAGFVGGPVRGAQ